MPRLLLATLVVTLAPLSAFAQTTEQRDYQVLVNGRDAGSSRIVVVEDKAGNLTMKGTASVRFQQLVLPYTFVSETQETWTGGKLAGLIANTTENGKKTSVIAQADANGLIVNVNGAVRAVSADVWVSSFWKLADRRFHNAKVPILEPDTGNDMLGKLEYVGQEKLTAANEAINCYHFRITGIATPTELWYDQHHRLVRQTFTERGQNMIVQLVSRR